MSGTSAFSEKKVFYWIEPIAQRDANWILFTAVCQQGLLMSGLGKCPEEEERYLKELTILAKRYLPGSSIVRDKEANLEVIKELREYLDGKRRQFTFKIYPLGTEFQLKVWQELTRIPYGETCSYSDIARKVDCPQGQRAVGLANNRNPLGVVIPCHRVIGKKGDLTGYAGGLEIKRMLLDLEKQGKSR